MFQEKNDIDNDEQPVPFSDAVLPMIFTAGMDYFGLGILTPLLPYFVEDLGESEAWVGWVTSAQYLGVLVGGICMGRIADIYSRKFAIQLACVGDVIFFLLTAFVPNVWMLMLVRFCAGSFTPLVPSISWVIDSGKGNTVVIARNMSIW